jgi:hypothetical protein
MEVRAAELLEAGPPFDPAEAGLARHEVYLSAGEVVFVFEGPEVDGIVAGLVDDPFHPRITDALAEWRDIVDQEHVRIARPAYAWPRRPDA